jgi:multisubunit Na+/H+ antiporter MnhF subunit
MLLKRTKRFLLIACIIFAALFGIRLLQGHTTQDALIHSAIWGTISSLIMIASGIYYARRNIDCPICNVPDTDDHREQPKS